LKPSRKSSISATISSHYGDSLLDLSGGCACRAVSRSIAETIATPATTRTL